MRALTKSAWVAAALSAAGLTGGGVTSHAWARPHRAAALPASTAAYRPAEVSAAGSGVVTMADQYNRPHPGPAATGATAWVAPSPPPAYVDTSPPPPRAPEPPPLAAVRNRQPAARAEGVDPGAARPELAGQTGAAAPSAAAPAARARPMAAASAADLAKGRQIFGANGCSGCHTLADAGAAGGIGPGLDHNPNLSPDFVFSTVHDGRGGMPSFAGQISDLDLRTLAKYIVTVSKK